ncbi:unnamed protein product [Vitrella brassicaformis CCMP3155]|uniref:Uncharacterized protein n=3 Tax=Vitrella brassicaformis TaxID=1169539 RepID=A0A0G4EDD4_VITBC|nr:unnamed protein product [Vitrella brassicaformis CCMP3155]|eukprot:CEL93710.1 unnamed protein product [Vitrella brassicaformis CCMP3155]
MVSALRPSLALSLGAFLALSASAQVFLQPHTHTFLHQQHREHGSAPHTYLAEIDSKEGSNFPEAEMLLERVIQLKTLLEDMGGGVDIVKRGHALTVSKGRRGGGGGGGRKSTGRGYLPPLPDLTDLLPVFNKTYDYDEYYYSHGDEADGGSATHGGYPGYRPPNNGGGGKGGDSGDDKDDADDVKDDVDDAKDDVDDVKDDVDDLSDDIDDLKDDIDDLQDMIDGIEMPSPPPPPPNVTDDNVTDIDDDDLDDLDETLAFIGEGREMPGRQSGPAAPCPGGFQEVKGTTAEGSIDVLGYVAFDTKEFARYFMMALDSQKSGDADLLVINYETGHYGGSFAFSDQHQKDVVAVRTSAVDEVDIAVGCYSGGSCKWSLLLFEHTGHCEPAAPAGRSIDGVGISISKSIPVFQG